MSRPQKMIIDGYNVIYTDDTLRRVAIKNLEEARRRFVERIKSYVAERALRVTVVFDGRGGLVDAETVIPGRLQVVFSQSGQSADELIVRTLQDSGQPQSYIVVTSDMADIGRTARGLGARIIRSRRFLATITVDGEPRAPEEDGAPDLGDTDYWLDKFGRDDSGE